MNNKTKILNIKYNFNSVEFVFFKYCFIELEIRCHNAIIAKKNVIIYKYCNIIINIV